MENISIKNKAGKDITLEFKNKRFKLTRQGVKHNDEFYFYWFEKNELKKELSKCSIDSKELKKIKDTIDNMNENKIISTFFEFEKYLKENTTNEELHFDYDFVKPDVIVEPRTILKTKVIELQTLLNKYAKLGKLEAYPSSGFKYEYKNFKMYDNNNIYVGYIFTDNIEKLDRILKGGYNTDAITKRLVNDFNKFVDEIEDVDLEAYFIYGGVIIYDKLTQISESDYFDEGPQPGDAEYHYPKQTISSGLGRFNNIDWKMVHETLLVNMEPDTLKFNSSDFTDNDEGLMNHDELNYLEYKDIIAISNGLPIIEYDEYLNYEPFYNACKSAWEEALKENTQIPSKDKLMNDLKHNFKDYAKPGSIFPVEVKNDKGEIEQVLNFHVLDNGELEIKDEDGIVESSKLIKGLAALCLIGGTLTSCKKNSGPHYGYNLNYATTTYTKNQGSNKQIEVFTKNGIQKYNVDSNAGKEWRSPNEEDVLYWASSALITRRQITPTEAYILKAGIEYTNEISISSTSGDDIIDIKPDNIEISSQDYTESEKFDDDCRSHPYFKNGLIALKLKGENSDALLSKANNEVTNQIWFEADDDKNAREKSELQQSPKTLDSSNYMMLFKGVTPKKGKYFMESFSNWVKPFISVGNVSGVRPGMGKLNVYTEAPNTLTFLGRTKDVVEFKNGYWNYFNGTKTFKLKIVWDGKTLSLYNSEWKYNPDYSDNDLKGLLRSFLND